MKQGTGRNGTSGAKMEPTTRGVNPGAVARMGAEVSHMKSARPEPLYSGATKNGKAPMSKSTHHCCGSQGKY